MAEWVDGLERQVPPNKWVIVESRTASEGAAPFWAKEITKGDVLNLIAERLKELNAGAPERTEKQTLYWVYDWLKGV